MRYAFVWALALAGCGSPLVGAECRADLALCAGMCVDLASDPRHCGACNNACDQGQQCVLGACEGTEIGPLPIARGLVPECAAPRLECDGLCVDPERDPDHCGGCASACDSGVCEQGRCALPLAGHAVLIGHDYREGRPGMNQIVGNAVFLARRSPVRVLTYEGAATAASILGTDAAIQQVARGTGRTWTRTVVSEEDVPTRLSGADVLLVYAQPDVSEDALARLSGAWGAALWTFLHAGGVVVVLDGRGAGPGTHRLLVHAGLVEADGRTDVSHRIVSVVDASDAVALGVPLSYRAEHSTVRFEGAEDAVVTDGQGPVVIHRTFAP